VFLFNYKFSKKNINLVNVSLKKKKFNDFNKTVFKNLVLYKKFSIFKKKMKMVSKKQNKNLLKIRLDIFLKLLVPVSTFILLRKINKGVSLTENLTVLWPAEYLDILGLILYSNPIFLNTSFFDLSAYSGLKSKKSEIVIFYLFKIPVVSGWLIVFVSQQQGVSNKKKINILSLETLFKSLSWAEREVSELFGIFFLFKKNNRKLISDYFLKIYPMLKWVPSVGFSEVYLSSEGFFFNRPIRVFNGSLS